MWEWQPFDLGRIDGRAGLDFLIHTVVTCGRRARALQQSGMAAAVESKADGTPVTEIDLTVEGLLKDAIVGRYRQAAFLGEESGAEGVEDAPLRFIVDPIDGTRALTRDLPNWSVLLGLEADDVPAVGIVFFPALDQLYYGIRGHGAYGNGSPLRVSGVREVSAAMVQHTGIGAFRSENHFAGLQHLADRCFGTSGLGDALGYVQVWLGRSEAMLDPIVAPWDVCPHAVITREAGGHFTALSGEETIRGKSAIASNGYVHNSILSYFNTSSACRTMEQK